MKNKILPGVFVLLFCVIFTATPLLAEFNIATVNVNKVLNESQEAQTKKKDLDKLSLQAKNKIDEKRKSLQATEKKIQEGKISEDSQEARNFRTEARDFARFVKDAEADLRSEFLKHNKVLTEKAVNLIAQYAKTNNIDLVIDKSDDSRGPVLYSSNTSDITDAIIKKINQ